MKTRIRTISIIFILLALVGGSVCGVFFTIIKHNIEHAYSVEADLETKTLEEKQGSTVGIFLKDIAPDVELLQSRIIDSDGTVAFIEQIESLAKSAGATTTIDSIAIKGQDTGKKKPGTATSTPSEFENLQLSITAEGSWNSVYTFLNMIESLPYKSSIQSVVLSRDTDWSAHFSITILKRH